MAKGKPPPPGETPVRFDTLHETAQSRVTRLYLPDRSVIRKEPLGADRSRRLRQELDILRRLRGLDGVAQLADSPSYPGSIVLEDIGGSGLGRRYLPLHRDELLRLAVGLARVVAGVHRRGVVHRDIAPANVLLSGSDQTPCLVDFALATSFAEIRPDFVHHNQIVGTLPYLAPEQTGRTGRPVDQRADLYALGATLYELATGAPPFGDGDPMALIHDHLARVPVRPSQVNPDVPSLLSEIIMHLLEKEPDSRYQTADGLLHDLTEVRDGRTGLRIGQRDFPPRPLTPTRLVGRDDEIASLETAFADGSSGKCHSVLVSGPQGVGKTSLVNEMRLMVADSDGWFVSGTFKDDASELDGIVEALRSLGRLLLAEPDDQFADIRAALARSLGGNAEAAAALIPELEVLLGVRPDLGDPMTVHIRAQNSAVAILRAVASPARPVALVLDDLHWAPRASIDFFDLAITDPELTGLVLVGAYNDEDVDPYHPLAALLSRWERERRGPERLRLGNLSTPDLAKMVADMLRLEDDAASGLAEAIAPYTNGNPYETVELVNALRHYDILVPTADGWHWERSALTGYLGRADLGDVVPARPDALSIATRGTLEALACLGTDAELAVLRDATGHSQSIIEQLIAPALDDGLLMMEPGDEPTVQFRHDGLRDRILAKLGPGRQTELRLAMARRLARVPERFAEAAAQYLPVVGELKEAAERRMVAGLLSRASGRAKDVAHYVMVDKFSAAALALTDPADRAALLELNTQRHGALYSMGRLEEADQVYNTVERLASDPGELLEAALVQMGSLSNRNHYRKALDVGVDLLRQFGIAVPTAERLGPEIGAHLDWLYQWIERGDETEDPHRPAISDPALLASAAVFNRMMPAAYFAGQAMISWASLEALRTWAVYGPAPALVGPASSVAFATIAYRQDYHTGSLAMRRIVSAAEARGYDTGAYQALLYNSLGSHWSEPIEESVRRSRGAREGLIKGGDLTNACYTYWVEAVLLFDCAPSLEAVAAVIDAGLAFARRTRDRATGESLTVSRQLVGVLRGEAGAVVDSPDSYAYKGPAALHAHLSRAIAALLLDQPDVLSRHTAESMGLLSSIVGTYPTAIAYIVRALAVASQARTAPESERGALLTELDSTIDWLSMRAADAPANFVHLLRLAQAERAWTVRDFKGAAFLFDAAGREAGARRRPWHLAITQERTARFYLDHGMEQAGRLMIADARQVYHDWGSTAKVDQLDWAYPTVQAPGPAATGGEAESGEEAPPTGRRASITPGTVDMLGILAVSQALSRETTMEGLRGRIEEVLRSMTGATGVNLLLRARDDSGWVLSTPESAEETAPIAEEGQPPRAPLSAVRYVERVQEPLVVADAIQDARFARDPYFEGTDSCSLLAVPLVSRGTLKAMLLLENRLISNAFASERLDGLLLVAGQLTVSLDNALVYASLERKVAERTQDLARATDRLEVLSITDPLTELANRRRLDDVLRAEWERGRRTGLPVAMAMLDIDHFKRFNDHYGHPAGDQCLQKMAAELMRRVRSTDLVARYGGEEFCVVMPGTDVVAAAQLAERLRTAIAALAVAHRSGIDKVVTVSIGVAAVVPNRDIAPQLLIDEADSELYRAKHGGRNRVRATPSHE